VIDRCPYRLVVPKTLSEPLTFSIDGEGISLRPARIAISDGHTTVRLAEANTKIAGTIAKGSSSTLRFVGAFGPGYDLEFVAEKGGFHQNLVISKEPAVPAGVAIGPAEFQVYTEIGLDSFLSRSGREIRIADQRISNLAELSTVEAPGGATIAFCTSAGTGNRHRGGQGALAGCGFPRLGQLRSARASLPSVRRERDA